MKNLKKVLALVLAVVMIMGVVSVASAKTYKDVDSTNTYADAIDALSSLSILDGFEDETFKSEGTLTRAQAAKIVAIVHNAATNGKIKGQDAISALYSNAQNPFVDCNNSWALPFINYCRITGLADGMTATTYAPNRELTGVQWLKLMLTTLNFDTAKEGYTGTGWDVNVLNRANEVGLTAGLAKGWKAIAPITRGEAAQILFNALQAYLVEYGQLVKNNYVASTATGNTAKEGYYKSSFISNEQVAKSGYTLGGKMNITIDRMYDVFGRPGTMWKYGSWSKFYMDAPLASFTGTATECDILVGAGIPKTSTATMKYDYFENGAWLQYHGSNGARTLSHAGRHCENTNTNPAFGATGALTQVFAADDGKTYIITRIDTVLTKVTKVNDTSKHGNNGGESNVDIYNRNALQNNLIVLENEFDMSSKTGAAKYIVEGLYSYAKNSYVLAHMSSLIADAAAYRGSVYEGKFYLGDALVETSATTTASSDVYTVANAQGTTIDDLYFVPVKVADSKVQKLTGRALTTTGKLSLDGEQVPTARGYILDEARVETVALLGNSYTFFRDQYDNVIADIEAGTEYAYGVLDGIYWKTNGATYSDGQSALAGIVKAGDNAVTDIVVSKVDGTKLMGVTENNKAIDDDLDTDTARNIYGAGDFNNKTVSPIKANNPSYTSYWHAFGVAKYVVDANGNYELTYAPQADVLKGIPGTNLVTDNTITSTQPKLAAGYIADENTVFVVKTVKAGAVVYTSYTGIKNVPTIKEPVAVVAYKDGQDFVPFVYVDATNSIFAGNTAVAFVTDPNPTYEEQDVVYTFDNVYINGVKTPVQVYKAVYGANAKWIFSEGTGLYELSYDAEGKVCAVKKLAAGTENKVVNGEIIKSISGNIVKNYSGTAINVENAKVYFVLKNGAGAYVDVVEKTVADLDDDMTYLYTYADANASWMADTVYVYVDAD